MFEHLEVAHIDDPEVAVLYSQGFSQRAKRLQAGVKRTHRWLERVFGREERTYLAVLDVQGRVIAFSGRALAVLDESDWRQACIPPYGSPHTVWDGPRGFVVSSYDYHDAMIDAMLRVVAQAPARLEREFRKVRGSDESNIIRFMDLVATSHEICHLFTSPQKLPMGCSWLPEMFSHYLTYAYLRETSPRDAHFWKLCEDAWASQRDITYTTIADYEMHHADMPLENYLWYQGRFNQRGAQLYGRMGRRFADRVIGFEVTEEGVYRRLAAISRDFPAWVAGFH